ncbi:MAG TPA: LysR substrate-binding domain-containing protein [Opitutaceae bacterium]|nr:LysR substrate-binding domain-containing protein [Opitutaceae bacterium]
MELRHLRYFVAVAEEQNVTRAAERLHVSQPPLSRQIRNLEDELGVALFTRSAKSVHLTEAGLVFLGEARAVLERADSAVRTVKAVASGQRGEIHLGYAPSLVTGILPCALRFFQDANPGVRVRLHDMSTQEMLNGLRNEKLHVALLFQVSIKGLTGLNFDELRRYPVSVAMHPTHPLARARKIGVEQIVRERLITYTISEYPEYHAWLSGLFAPLKRSPQIGEEHDSSTSLIASVEAGRGVALIPQGFDSQTGTRLKVRPLNPAPPPLVVGIAHRKDLASPVAKSFIAAVKQATQGVFLK